MPVNNNDKPRKDEDHYQPPPAYAKAHEMDQADWQLDEAIPDAVRSPPPIAADDIGLGHVPSGEEARKHYVDRLALMDSFH